MFKKTKKRNLRIKTFFKDILTDRILILGFFLMLLFGVLVLRLFKLQIVEGDEHLANFNYKVEKTISTNASRGRIFDCNGKLLAYSQLAYSVQIQSSDRIAEIAKERSKTLNMEVKESTVRNEIIYNLIKVLEKNGEKVIYNLPIRLSKTGELEYTVSGSKKTRFLKDVYSINNLETLSGDELLRAQEYLNASASTVFEYLRSGKNGPVGSGNMFNIDEAYSMEDALKIMSVRYDIYMNRYSQTTPITVANNITEESIAALSEYLDEFPGVSIEANYLRVYKKSEVFSSIIGYTGIISEEERTEYNKDGGDYTANDIVGKTGIEKTMESTLKGNKGYEKVLVDNLGKIIKTVDVKEATVGNDIYLTLDTNLQEYAYNILERRLAGIILAHLTSNDEEKEEKMIPYSEVLYALINNNIVDVTNLGREDARLNEKEVYSIYKNKEDAVFSLIRNELKESKVSYNALTEEKQEYLDFVIKALEEQEFIDQIKVDESDETYQAWKEGTISFSKYIKYAINNEWIRIEKLPIPTDYYSENEILDEILNQAIDYLKENQDFQKLLFKHMIKKREISFKRICMLLYNQGVLDSKTDTDYSAFANDEISASRFLYLKIQKIQITPAQLALDPCSGSVVITDPNTGEVRAMVSYPSYDNNKLANEIDSAYFAQLNADLSSPMLNRCTQTKTAPGSTFKPISATAVLEEGIINQNTKVKCTGLFDKIQPSAKCWIYPDKHDKLNVSNAIAVSCNSFFYEMGYRLGTRNGIYDNTFGLTRIQQYASKYGLNQKSGVQITEYDPQISDEDAVRSSIGQGTHDYTPSQIARYVTSLVNENDLLDLTLLSKTVSADGKTTKEYKKTTNGKLDVNPLTFNIIKNGMVAVVNGKNSSIKELFEKQDMKVAGKTGTAQENKKKPNHALFISYAPYNKPEITMTVVVRNGYSSHNAAEIARDIYRFYFGKATKDEKNATNALLPTGNDSSND